MDKCIPNRDTVITVLELLGEADLVKKVKTMKECAAPKGSSGTKKIRKRSARMMYMSKCMKETRDMKGCSDDWKQKGPVEKDEFQRAADEFNKTLG